MAHFLKSVSLEIGQVASSVTLLMKTPHRPGHVDEATGYLVPALKGDAGLDLPSPRFDPGEVPGLESALFGILGVDEEQGFRHRRMELRHSPGHGARVPVFQHAPGAKPQVVGGVR